MNPIDLTGVRFGMLTALSLNGRIGKRRAWLCKCDCGSLKTITQTHLRHGTTISCGCWRAVAFRAVTKHGKSNTREYTIWSGIVFRCTNPTATNYARYGGRGIFVSNEWLVGTNGLSGFEVFLKDMGTAPEPSMSIDRIDNDGPYAAWNCRWATPKEQSANTSRNVKYTINGQTKPLCTWCEVYGVKYGLVYLRLKWGWSIERALTAPVRKMQRRAA